MTVEMQHANEDNQQAEASSEGDVPARAGLVMATLIMIAAVANMPLAMANVALAGTPGATSLHSTVTNELTMSYAGAQAVAEQYPHYADQITAAAKSSFLVGGRSGLYRWYHRCSDRRSPGLFPVPKKGRRATDASGVPPAGYSCGSPTGNCTGGRG